MLYPFSQWFSLFYSSPRSLWTVGRDGSTIFHGPQLPLLHHIPTLAHVLSPAVVLSKYLLSETQINEPQPEDSKKYFVSKAQLPQCSPANHLLMG